MTVWMLQLLGVRGAIELFLSVTVSMLFALGTSKYAAVGNVLKLVFLTLVSQSRSAGLGFGRLYGF